MAHTNNIRETILKDELIRRCCWQCSRNFNNEDWITNNWEIEYRINHKPAWKTFFPNDDRGWIGWEVQLRHNNCNEHNKMDNLDITDTSNLKKEDELDKKSWDCDGNDESKEQKEQNKA